MFKIKYYYRTGDSFSSRDEEDVLEFDWENLDVAKQCLQRIKEHYKWYESHHSYSGEKLPKPDWYNPKSYDKYEPDMGIINLITDDGEDFQFWAPWCGHFETLYGAEIVLNEKISF